MPDILRDGDYWVISINGRQIQCETYNAALELAAEYRDN